VIPFLKLGSFPQEVFDSPTDVLDFERLLLLCDPRSFQFLGPGSQGVERMLVLLRNVGGALCQFGFETIPVVLAGMLLLLWQEAEGLLGAQLGDSGEAFDAEAIQNLGACEFACPEAERTFDSFGCHRWFGGHVHWQ
jgi:hypothetical protein